MTITKATEVNNEMYRQLTVNNLDKRHEALRVEELHVREALKANEAKRVEINRQMNRPGQAVDKLA